MHTYEINLIEEKLATYLTLSISNECVRVLVAEKLIEIEKSFKIVMAVQRKKTKLNEKSCVVEIGIASSSSSSLTLCLGEDERGAISNAINIFGGNER